MRARLPGMAQQIVLLRGINLGPRNRIAMPQLRAALEAAGFEGVPKRYLVSFLDANPSRETVRRSKLWALLAGQSLGVTATARNWTTVTKLLELAGG